MEITIENYDCMKSEIEQSIKNSLFISIDTEFSGLNSKNDRNSVVDTVQDRYSKIRNSCMDHALLSFGLSIFSLQSSGNLCVNSFDFILFPATSRHFQLDSKYLFQMSSAKFLVQNGFDFNKVFSQGIPFLTWDQERHCRNRLGRKRKDELCEEDEKFLALIYEKINVWLQNGTGDLKMDELDGYQRRLIAANAPEK